MGYNAHITDTKTGETRVCRMDFDWTESSAFWWDEGNFSCDCNRGATFSRAGGEDPDALDDEEDAARFPCGDNRYWVRCVSDDGAVLFEDDPIEPPPLQQEQTGET